jgi:hypothetical protein
VVKLTIGPHRVDILVNDLTTNQLMRDNKFGDSDVEQLKIRVRADLPRSVFQETLVHEVLHHVIGMTAWVERLSDEQQEDLIRSISPYLAQLGMLDGVTRKVLG